MLKGIIESMEDRQRMALLEAHESFPAALRIIKRLCQAGHRAVVAGGSVRDALLGVPLKDFDIATSAPPDLIEASFPRTLAVGKAFGTIVVIEDGQSFEVTTFRSDGPYLDGRHPSHVQFSGIKEDAKRRDFTVNALFYDPLNGEIIDLVNGLPDLKARRLRTVGMAGERFTEDHLRMLRAIRFVSQLGFALDKDVLQAIQEHRSGLKKVSVERVFNECKRFLASANLSKGLRSLLDSKLYEFFWPEIKDLEADRLADFPAFVNWENAFAAIQILSGTSAEAEARLKAWKVSRESLRRVTQLLNAIAVLGGSEPVSRAARARLFGSDVYAELVCLCQGLFGDERTSVWIDEYLQIAGPTGELPNPFVSGDDLLHVGISPGVEMGRLLRDLYDSQLEGRVKSRAAALQEIAKIKA